MDKEQTLRELNTARELWGKKSTTPGQMDLLLKGLVHVLVHCPEDMTPMVSSHIVEAIRRIQFMEFDLC